MSTKEAVLQRAESFLTEWLPGGKKEGTEFRAGGIDGGKGRSLAVSMTEGCWTDHATGESGGDLISLYAQIRGIDYKEAARQLASQVGTRAPSTPIEKAQEGKLINPVPDNVSAPTFRHFKLGIPSAAYEYRNPNGGVFGYVCRFDTPDGKQILPMTYRRTVNGSDWRWKGFGNNRPLYRGEEILDSGRIIIVEGEKCADALSPALPQDSVISWQGGAKAIKHSDWSPIKGRDVVIWPDNDEGGIEAARDIRRILGTRARIVTPPNDKPKKWDCADAIEEGFDCEAFLADPEVEDAADTGLPFFILGCSGDEFFYLPHNGGSVVRLTASGHTKQNLMRLAPLSVWEDQFPSKSGVDWDAVCNALINQSQSLEQFNPKRIRGRGCWFDAERSVYHHGNGLMVDGKPVEMAKFNSANVYPSRVAIDFCEETAPDHESRKLLELCRSLTWRDDGSGDMLAGWLALAPISGVLNWRPHLWLTGRSGAGKSWVFENIVQASLGNSVVAVQGNTTEAGIRSSLGSDSLPVIFDEAEAENQHAAQRIERVMELARQASSEGSSGIIKGTATGGSITYFIRSMFLFSSIGVSSVKKADTSRISVLELNKNKDPGQFSLIKQLCADSVFRAGFGDRIRARAVRNAILIRESIAVFVEEAAAITGDKRSADQLGTLLAGAYSLTTEKPASPAIAREWLSRASWLADECDQAKEVDRDENLCLAHLMASLVNTGAGDATIDELVSRANDGEPEAMSVLRRHGMRLQDGFLLVANNGPELEKIFRDTPWSAGKWPGQLARLDGALRLGAIRFSPQVVQRCVKLPICNRNGV